MEEAVTAADTRYSEVFDLTQKQEGIVGDLTITLNQWRERGAVLEGSDTELLGCHDIYDHYRKGYTFLTFKVVDKAFRDPDTFANRVYTEMEMVRGYGSTILWKDGDDHRRYRALAQHMFLQQSAQTWWKENWGDEIVRTLLDNIEHKERSDLNMDLCVRLPMQLITQAFGMKGEEALEFRENLDISVGVVPNTTSDEKAAAAKRVDDALHKLVSDRRRDPKDDIISGLLAGDLELEDGASRKLTDEEVFGYCRLVMHAGGGTTWRQLGITILLCLRGGYWQELGQNRALVPAAIEESIRFMPTDPFMPRLVTKDVEVEGVHIAAGSRVSLCMASANRDPARWENPDVYDIHRPYRYNLGTAVGPHQCLGHSVTRAEMAWAINGLLDRFPNMRLDPDAPQPEYIGNEHQRGISTLPVILR